MYDLCITHVCMCVYIHVCIYIYIVIYNIIIRVCVYIYIYTYTYIMILNMLCITHNYRQRLRRPRAGRRLRRRLAQSFVCFSFNIISCILSFETYYNVEIRVRNTFQRRNNIPRSFASSLAFHRRPARAAALRALRVPAGRGERAPQRPRRRALALMITFLITLFRLQTLLFNNSNYIIVCTGSKSLSHALISGFRSQKRRRQIEDKSKTNRNDSINRHAYSAQCRELAQRLLTGGLAAQLWQTYQEPGGTTCPTLYV